jgi:MinD superfamily P-loop ATPase
MAQMVAEQHPYVIVLGNEKGGSGKSTTAIHIVVALLREGYRVGAMDLDARQATLGGTLAARRHFIQRKGIDLPMPDYREVMVSTADLRPVRCGGGRTCGRRCGGDRDRLSGCGYAFVALWPRAGRHADYTDQ